MKIAGTGLGSATVADIGLRAAAKVDWVLHDPEYNPYHHCDDDGPKIWNVFMLYLATLLYATANGASNHVEWLLQQQYATPDEWLGEEGRKHRDQRRRTGWTQGEPSDAFKAGWVAFAEEHQALSLEDIALRLDAIPKEPSRRTRGKRRVR